SHGCACTEENDRRHGNVVLQFNNHVRQETARVKAKSSQGLLPICASCKKIRDDHGIWNHVEAYIERSSGVHCSHGICPDCVNQVYPEVAVLRQSGPVVLPGDG
ncbi:MAG: hypothetical protein OEL66_07060, partial [Desulfobulbaceae bacterium]|nr:hypothetical protein [Desulfobulbaceae bacterium]